MQVQNPKTTKSRFKQVRPKSGLFNVETTETGTSETVKRYIEEQKDV